MTVYAKGALVTKEVISDGGILWYYNYMSPLYRESVCVCLVELALGHIVDARPGEGP